MDLPLIAIGAATTYFAISWVVGDRFPFSRYAMYADLGGRREGAVLVVRAGGREVAFQDVVAWHGIDPESIDPFKVPCSLHWVVFEAQAWIRDHTVASAEGLAVPIEVGYRIVRVPDVGEVTERFEWRGAGVGRLR